MRELFEQAAERAEPIEWVIEKTLAAGCVYILAGRAKATRKTLTCMHMGRCVSSGHQFFGRKTYSRPVVYTMLEDGEKRARRRAARMGFHNPSWQPGAYMVEYEIEDYQETMRQMQAGELRNAFWVIDSLPEIVGFLGLDENSAPEMTRLIRAHRKVAQAANSTILFIHHLNKSGETMRGSTAFEAAGDGYAEAKRQKNGVSGVGITWTLRDAEDQLFIVDLSRGEDGYLFFAEVDPEEARRRADEVVDNEVLSFMAGIPFEQGVSLDDISTGVNTRRGARRGDKKYVSRRTVIAPAVQRLREKGALFEGKGRLTYRDRTWWEVSGDA